MENSPKMERDAVPPRVTKKRPTMADFKLEMPIFDDRLHNFQFHATTTKYIKLLPDLIAKLAVPIYFFTITSTWYLGMFEVMPVLYRDFPESSLFYQRVFMVIIYLEMMLNWLCIRYVDSSYMAYLKQQWSRKRHNDYDSGGREKVEDSSLTPMLLLEENGLSSFRNENGFHGTENPHPFQHFGSGNEAAAFLQQQAPAATATTMTTTETHHDRHKNHDNDSNNINYINNSHINNSSSSSSSSYNRNRSHNNTSSQSHSSPPWKPPFRPPQHTTFPYWSWVPCYVCELMRPPRCHHCPLCQTCVLKRDHHCFFAGSCVGWRNQRHFLIFCCWALFGCCYATFYALCYLQEELWFGMRWFDLLAPVTLLRWFLGYATGFVCFSVWVQSLLIYFILLSATFVNEHLQLIRKGLTSFEVSSLKKTVELRDFRGLFGRFRAVLGPWWLLNVLCPLHWVFEAREDPENWPAVKVYRH